MGWLNINGNWIGRHSGKSWHTDWNTLTLTVNSIENGFRLTWDKSTTTDSIDIWASTDNVTFTRIAMVNPGVTSYDDITPLGLTVYYKVRAVKDSTVFGFTSVQPGTLDQVAITFKVDTGYDVVIDYGEDGDEYITANGHDCTMTSAYSTTSTTYRIFIFGKLTHLKKILIDTEATLSGLDIDDFATANVGLTYLDLEALTGCSGSIENLPLTVYYLRLVNVATITGELDNHLPYLYFAEISTQPSVTANISNLPAGIRKIQLSSIGSSSGDTEDLPVNLETLTLDTIAGITCVLDDIPMTTMRWLKIKNLTTPPTGSIDNFPDNIVYLHIELSEAGSITGDIGNLPNQAVSGGSAVPYLLAVYNIYLKNLGNAITGHIEDAPSNLSTWSVFYIVGCGTNIIYNGGELASKFDLCNLTIQCGLTTANLDAFLIAWDAVTSDNVNDYFYTNLAGNNQARSETSDASVVSLTAKHKQITFTT
jgi:hypothetical protein